MASGSKTNRHERSAAALPRARFDTVEHVCAFLADLAVRVSRGQVTPEAGLCMGRLARTALRALRLEDATRQIEALEARLRALEGGDRPADPPGPEICGDLRG
jgi:hypothetical protein